MTYPATIDEFLLERMSFWKTFPDTHPEYPDAKTMISKTMYCRSLDVESLEYKEVVNSIIDTILKKNYELFPIAAASVSCVAVFSENGMAVKPENRENEEIKEIHKWCDAIEKLKL